VAGCALVSSSQNTEHATRSSTRAGQPSDNSQNLAARKLTHAAADVKVCVLRYLYTRMRRGPTLHALARSTGKCVACVQIMEQCAELGIDYCQLHGDGARVAFMELPPKLKVI
jgi:hypothetical protein